MLSLISTPIGNLGDLSKRAAQALDACAYVLAEDTRVAQILLKDLGLHKRLVSFHGFNERTRMDPVLNDLQQGMHLSLISDAGTPLICDPGQQLVRAARDLGIRIEVIPGPCAVIAALTWSGLCSTPFHFFGFVPTHTTERQTLLKQCSQLNGTSIFYEAPHRLVDTLQDLETMCPSLRIGIAREITKKFEEYVEGTARELIDHFQVGVRGEIVLLFSGAPAEAPDHDRWLAALRVLVSAGLPPSAAAKALAQIEGVSKNQIYPLLSQLK